MLSHRRARPTAALAIAAALALAGCTTAPGSGGGTPGPGDAMPSGSAAAAAPITVGAAFPLSADTGGLAQAELAGLRIAVSLANADGGVYGHPIALDVADLPSADAAPAVMAKLKADGAAVVVGAYESDVSMAASAAADAAGLVYWESGSVADRLTGRGLPLVFRVGASGTTLGSNSSTFAVDELASRLGRTAATLRIAIVSAEDAYATSVADAAEATARVRGSQVVLRQTYLAAAPDWASVMAALAAARPDVVILASHIPDGIAFRRAMLAAHLRVGALIGSTMAECSPDFGGELGADAVGVFASDRPVAGFDPAALGGDARAAYDRFEAAWVAATTAGAPGTSGVTGPEAAAAATFGVSGPTVADATAAAAEEGLSGFSAGWALFVDVLPAVAGGSFDADSIATAARAMDLPAGALPNGAGLRFSADAATLGQNTRAAGIVWQWQATRHYEVVWPATYATAPITLVPLPR